MKKPESAGTKQKRNDTRFKPGQSGNPAGKPRGTRHKATMAALVLLEGEAEKLTRKAIDLALGGDMAALRLCLERIVAPAKERPVSIDIPVASDAAGLVNISAAILAAVGNGEMDPGQAAALARVVEVHRSTIEMNEIEGRLTKLEESIDAKQRN